MGQGICECAGGINIDLAMAQANGVPVTKAVALLKRRLRAFDSA